MTPDGIVTISTLPVLLPALLLAAAVVTTIVGTISPRVARWVAVVSAAAVTLLAASGLARVIDGEVLTTTLGGWSSELGISYRMDLLSGFLATLVALIGFLAVLYPPKVGYQTKPDRNLPIHGLSLLLLTGVMGVVMSSDLFNLFVFLEIYSIAAYALIALGGPLAALAAFRYLLIGTVGSSIYLLGVGFVYFSTGTLNMAEASQRLLLLGESPTVITAAVLLVAGLAVKMALFPMHVWVPDAHSNATPSVHVFLASVMVKVGAYAVIRIVFDVLPPGFTDYFPLYGVLVTTGIIGIVFGSWMSFRQDDYKRMLAYSTVAQMGFISIGIGLDSTVALVGALLLVLVHSFMKAVMFFVAGSVYESTGRKKIPQFAGLGRRMPWTMVGFTVAAASMVGLPPTGGFFSKFYLVLGAAQQGTWIVAVVVVGSSLMTLAYFLPIVEAIWFKPDLDGPDAPRCESSTLVVLPIAALAVGIVAIGIVNVAIVDALLEPMANSLTAVAGL